MKAKRNKTIDLSVSEGSAYLSRVLRADAADGAAEFSRGEVTDRTILGDNLGAMARLPRGFADLMIADPPYNIEKSFGASTFHRRTIGQYEAYTREWLSAALPILKPDASVYICCDWTSSGAIERVLRECLYVRNRITWQREKGRGAGANWKNAMEDIWFATVSDRYTFHSDAVMQRRKVLAPYRKDGAPKDWEETETGNFRNTHPSNFWDDITVPFWSMPENTAHPTQKPEKLLAKLILASSDAGDMVFDPFLGSGSTAVTAKKLGRHFVGIEREETYLVWAEKRLSDAEENPRIQGYEDGVFWERNARVGK